MVKRKTPEEVKPEAQVAEKPKPPAKKTKPAAAKPKAEPSKKAPASAAATKKAAATKEVPEKKDKAVPAPKKSKKVETEDAALTEKPAPKARATKAAKETTAAPKTVKVPKPKTSPAKVKTATASKTAKVPRVATPEKPVKKAAKIAAEKPVKQMPAEKPAKKVPAEKPAKKPAAEKPAKKPAAEKPAKKPAAPRAKKAAVAAVASEAPAERHEEEPDQEMPEASGSDQEVKAPEVPESRKRTKPAKEVVAPKKPKIEIVVPFRQQRGTGVVLTMGQGDVGQLGLGPDVLEKSRPTSVTEVKDVVDVVAGGMHTVCLTSNGEIYTFGCNDEGALGRDTSEEGMEFEPGKVELPGKVTNISAGDSHSAALLEDGRVFIWGTFRDSHGPMGLNSSGAQKRPIPILEGIPMVQIASGADHFVCLSADGQVYTCGCAEQGQLGRVAEVFSNRGGRKGKDYLLTPQPVALGKGKKKIAIDCVWTGSYATFARARETGAIYVFGLNNYNQLGLPSQDTRFQPEISDGFKGHRWLSISCGQHHTLALDEEGKVYSLGRKEYGRLGMGENATDLAVPTLIPGLQAEKCVEVAAGESVSFAVTESGVAYSWGMGTNGQLGLGHEDDVHEPASIQSKSLASKTVLLASAGGQHAVLLAAENASTVNGSTDNKPEQTEAPVAASTE